MRIHILSALLGVTATLLAVAMFWPGAAPTTHAQTDGVLQLDPEWNNVAYGGDPLPIEEALNDALGITDTVWLWRSLERSWDSWTQGALDLLNSLGGLDRGDVVWLRTHQAGLWTQLGAAQTPGAAGLSCWDLNGNGAFDAATEDANADGIADALDCRGEPGLPGRACWDLNANGEPDPAEDITGDGTANALDCRGKDAEFSSVFLTTALTGVVEVLKPETGSGHLEATADCPANTVLTGGGAWVSSAGDIKLSYPVGNSWRATADGGPKTLNAYALCATSGFVLGGSP